jgi:hypothetical protein
MPTFEFTYSQTGTGMVLAPDVKTAAREAARQVSLFPGRRLLAVVPVDPSALAVSLFPAQMPKGKKP